MGLLAAWKTSKRLLRTREGLTLCLALAQIASVNAASVEVHSRLKGGMTWSDNVKLESEGEESDVVFELSPGIQVSAYGKHNILDFDYSMQNLLFVSNTDDSTIRHNFRGDWISELLDDYFYLDVAARVGQRSVDFDQGRGGDNLDILDDRETFYTYRVSPFFLHNFSNVVLAELRLTHTQFSTLDDDEVGNDSTSNTLRAAMSSGRALHHGSWHVEYNLTRRESENNNNQNNRRESWFGQYTQEITREFGLIGQAGYENNAIEGQAQDDNGAFWSAGIIWQPSPKLRLRALAGSRSHEASIRLSSYRTFLEVVYRNRDVGLVVGPSWFVDFQHSTKRTVWQARYTEEFTNQEELIFAGTVLIPDPVTGDPIPVDNFELEDEEFFRRRGEVSFEYGFGNTAQAYGGWNIEALAGRGNYGNRNNRHEYTSDRRRGNFMLLAFYEQRRFDIDVEEDEDFYGFINRLSFGFSAVSTLALETALEFRDLTTRESDDDFLRVTLSYLYSMTRYADLRAFVSHRKRFTSGDIDNDFDANRVGIEFLIRYNHLGSGDAGGVNNRGNNRLLRARSQLSPLQDRPVFQYGQFNRNLRGQGTNNNRFSPRAQNNNQGDDLNQRNTGPLGL